MKARTEQETRTGRTDWISMALCEDALIMKRDWFGKKLILKVMFG